MSSKYTNFYLYDDKFAIVCQINNTKKGTAGRAGGFERMTAVFFAVTVEHEPSTLAKIRITFCFVEISITIVLLFKILHLRSNHHIVFIVSKF